MADNVKEVTQTPPPAQPPSDDNRRRTRSQTRNGGVTPPAPVLETRGRKRTGTSQPGSGGKRGRKPAQASSPAEEHSKQEVNQDLATKQQDKQEPVVEVKPKKGEGVKNDTKSQAEDDNGTSKSAAVVPKPEADPKKVEAPVAGAKPEQITTGEKSDKQEQKQQQIFEESKEVHQPKELKGEKVLPQDEKSKTVVTDVKQTDKNEKSSSEGSHDVELPQDKFSVPNEQRTKEPVQQESNTEQKSDEKQEANKEPESDPAAGEVVKSTKEIKEHANLEKEKNIPDSAQDKPKVVST